MVSSKTKMMKQILFGIFSLFQLATGQVALIGSMKDEHGCVTDGGYQWCESLNECVRPWMTPCPTNQPIIDPGFGFGKTLDHNYLLLNSLKKYTQLGCRILSGISRKSMIGSVINKPPSERLYGSLAATVLAIRNKASILRVHDVRQTRVLLNFKDLMIEKT